MERLDRTIIRDVLRRDVMAIRRSKAIVIPMVVVPIVLLLGMPFALGVAIENVRSIDVEGMVQGIPGGVADELAAAPEDERIWLLVFGYLVAPLFIIVPLMVAAVLAADAFAGERERKTLEGLLHLPIGTREIFVAKTLGAFIPAVFLSWLGFALYAILANAMAWSTLHRIFVPTLNWLLLLLWVGPAITTLGLAAMVRVSARSATTQEANQLGGAVILPFIFFTVSATSAMLLTTWTTIFTIGLVLWVFSVILLYGGMVRFTRDRLVSRV